MFDDLQLKNEQLGKPQNMGKSPMRLRRPLRAVWSKQRRDSPARYGGYSGLRCELKLEQVFSGGFWREVAGGDQKQETT